MKGVLTWRTKSNFDHRYLDEICVVADILSENGIRINLSLFLVINALNLQREKTPGHLVSCLSKPQVWLPVIEQSRYPDNRPFIDGPEHHCRSPQVDLTFQTLDEVKQDSQ